MKLFTPTIYWMMTFCRPFIAVKLLIFLLPVKGYSDSLAPATAYKLKSENGRYALHTYPFSYYGIGGEAFVIDTEEMDTLYGFDQHLGFVSRIDNSGDYVVTIDSWPFKNESLGVVVIKFYKRGELIKSITLDKLVFESFQYCYSVSHISWYESSAISGNILQVKTCENQLFEFDLGSGEKISVKEATNIELARPEIIYRTTEDYPRLESIPKLKSTDDLMEEMNKILHFSVYENYRSIPLDTKTTSLMLFLTVNSNGVVVVKRLGDENKDNLPDYFETPEEKTQEIMSFLKSCEFDTNQIPSGIRKWLFHFTLYVG